MQQGGCPSGLPDHLSPARPGPGAALLGTHVVWLGVLMPLTPTPTPCAAAAFQDEKKVRIYDVHNNWRLVKSIHARQLRWTFTDACLSSDQAFLLYSTISSTVHLVNVKHHGGGGGSGGEDSGEAEVESVANITDIHEALQFGASEGDRNGIWSIKWSPDNREVCAGHICRQGAGCLV